jgi:hypothetical protein
MSEAELSELDAGNPPDSGGFSGVSSRRATFGALSVRPPPRLPAGLPNLPAGTLAVLAEDAVNDASENAHTDYELPATVSQRAKP